MESGRGRVDGWTDSACVGGLGYLWFCLSGKDMGLHWPIATHHGPKVIWPPPVFVIPRHPPSPLLYHMHVPRPSDGVVHWMGNWSDALPFDDMPSMLMCTGGSDREDFLTATVTGMCNVPVGGQVLDPSISLGCFA